MLHRVQRRLMTDVWAKRERISGAVDADEKRWLPWYEWYATCLEEIVD